MVKKPDTKDYIYSTIPFVRMSRKCKFIEKEGRSVVPRAGGESEVLQTGMRKLSGVIEMFYKRTR